jgi:hypothetical protein
MVEGGHHHNPEEQQELRIRRWRGTHAQQGGHPMNLVRIRRAVALGSVLV